MWLMFAHFDAAGGDPAILVVDHAGEPRCLASSVELALDWLGSIGQPEVGVEVEGGVEVYRITPLGASRLRRPNLAPRRTLPAIGGGNGQGPPGLCERLFTSQAPNRRARRQARASLRRQDKRRRRAGP